LSNRDVLGTALVFQSHSQIDASESVANSVLGPVVVVAAAVAVAEVALDHVVDTEHVDPRVKGSWPWAMVDPVGIGGVGTAVVEVPVYAFCETLASNHLSSSFWKASSLLYTHTNVT